MSSISDVAQLLNVSSHTLRYYEKIGLLAPVSKTSGGQRNFTAREIERVRFIKRAQRMHFSLEEIRALLELDSRTYIERPQAQKLVQEKLAEIETSLAELKHLKQDLNKMLKACQASSNDEHCPIIDGIKQG